MQSYSVEAMLKVAGASKFASDFKNASSSVADTGRKTEKTGLTIGKLAGAAGATWLVSKGFSAIKSSVSGAMDRIDTMEQFNRTMNVMVDDTDLVTGSMNKLETMVQGTGFRLDTMASATQNFVTRGMEIGQATDTVEAWGNAVAFYGDGSNEQFVNVTDALSTMVAKGKVDMQQMNRLTEAGIPALEMYAEATGRSTASVQKDLSDGTISAQEFVSVVTQSMSEAGDRFPDISNAMKDAGMSWNNVLTNMSNYMQQAMVSIIESIDMVLEDAGMDDMRTMIDNAGVAMKNSLTKVADAITFLSPVISGLLTIIKPFLPVIGAIVSAIVIMVTTMATINTAILIWGMLEKAIWGVVALLSTNPWMIWVTLALAAVLLIMQHWEPIKMFFQNVWRAIREPAMTLWQPIVAIFQWAMGVITATMQIIGNVATAVWDKFGNALIVIGATITGVFIPKLVMMGASALASGAQVVAGWVMSAAGAIANAAVMAAQALLVVGQWILMGVTAMAQGAVMAAGWIVAMGPVGWIIGVIVGLAAVIFMNWDWIQEKTADVFGWISDFISSVVDWISEKWNKFLNLFGKGTMDSAEEAENAFKQTGDAGKENLGSLSEEGSESMNTLNQNTTDSVTTLGSTVDQKLDHMNTDGTMKFNQLDTHGSDSMANLNASAGGDVQDLSGMSQEELMEMATGGTDSLSGLNVDGSGEIAEMEASVTGDVSEMESKATGDFSTLTKEMSAQSKEVRESVSESFAGMGSDIDKEMASISKKAGTSLKQISTGFATSMGHVTKIVRSSMQATSSAMSTSLGLMNKAVQASFQSMTNSVQSGTTAMSTASAKGISLMLLGYRAGMKSITTEMASGMSHAIKIVNAGNTAMVNSVNKLRSSFYSAGRNAMSGLTSGLASGSGAAISQARRTANRISSTLRKALKTRSPSKVTTLIGKQVAQGLAQGISKATGLVDKASSKMADSAIIDVPEPEFDVGKSMGKINNIANREIHHTFESNFQVEKQPAYITVSIAGQEFEAFVEDISEVQTRTTDLNKRFV